MHQLEGWSDLSSRVLVLALVFTIIMLSRLTPFIETHTPYSTDSWGIIRNTLVLTSNTPISLSSRLFDGYNNYWPVVSVTTAVYSVATGIGVYESSSIIPLVALLVFTLLVYIHLAWATSGRLLDRVLAVLALASSISIVQMTSGLVKEGYAYFLQALILLWYPYRRGPGSLLILALTGITLALTHHLTLLATASILVGLASMDILLLFSRGSTRLVDHLTALAACAAGGLIQYTALGRYFIPSEIVSTWIPLSLLSHIVFSTMLLLPLVRLLGGREPRPVFSTLSTLLVVPGYTAVEWAGRVLGFDTGGLALSTSIIAALLLARTALGSLKPRYVYYYTWVFTILSLVFFAYNEELPMAPSLAYRLLTFTIPPLTILAYASLNNTRASLTGLYRLLLEGYIALMLVAYVLTQTGLSPELGWHWRYSESSLYTAGFISSRLREGYSITSDVKYSYLLRGLYSVGVNVSCTTGQLTLIDEYMFKQGALLAPGKLCRLNKSVLDGLSIVYTNGLQYITFKQL